MSDFETHQVGTAQELKLLRDIATSIYTLTDEEFSRLPSATKALVEEYIIHCQNVEYDKIGVRL